MAPKETFAVVMDAPEKISVRQLLLNDAGPDDIVVEIDWSGISTGTERLLWSGRMPPFPGMGYPLVPGYESVGRIVSTENRCGRPIGAPVFVPGSSCFRDARGLFGGAARRLIVPATRAISLGDEVVGEEGVLLALAATAHHAVVGGVPPSLIVGHGVLGRLLARVTMALGNPAPTVWETNPGRSTGSAGYQVLHPDQDDRRDYPAICDVSGDANILDSLISRLSHGGEVVLAGFYEKHLSFAFPPTFMREARIRVAAEFKSDDVSNVLDLIRNEKLSLSGLITHRSDVSDAGTAYATAFGDTACLKMIIDWRGCA